MIQKKDENGMLHSANKTTNRRQKNRFLRKVYVTTIFHSNIYSKKIGTQCCI